MLEAEIKQIIKDRKKTGWIPEPEAKKIFTIRGIQVPSFSTAKFVDEAIEIAGRIKYPVVAKIVSSTIIHKSDVGGVVVGIRDDRQMRDTFIALSEMPGFESVLIEEMVSGIELIIGAKIDYQFGPIILLGIGGTGVEIYKDVTMRMAPIESSDVMSMVNSLKGRKLLSGYRGKEPVNLDRLSDLMVRFSGLIMDIEDSIESVDLNPVMCSAEHSIVADARIMLKEQK
jgi:acetate---CoA ligase (ADP-forming) subunit beta